MSLDCYTQYRVFCFPGRHWDSLAIREVVWHFKESSWYLTEENSRVSPGVCGHYRGKRAMKNQCKVELEEKEDSAYISDKLWWLPLTCYYQLTVSSNTYTGKQARWGFFPQSLPCRPSPSLSYDSCATCLPIYPAPHATPAKGWQHGLSSVENSASLSSQHKQPHSNMLQAHS